MVRCEVRAPAQPGDPAPGGAQLHHQGPDPGADGALPGQQRRGLRPDVRARQGRPPRARHPARGRLRRQVLRGRAGLPDQARRLRAPRDRLRRRRGGRARAGGPGLAARRTRRRHLGRAGQAQGRRAQLRPRAARPRRSRRWPPRSRRSRRCGRPRCTARRCGSTTAAAGAARAHHAPPPAVGRGHRRRAAGTSPASTPTAASRGCSGSAGSVSEVVADRRRRARTPSRRAPTCAPCPSRSTPREPDRTRRGAGPRRVPRTGCAAAPTVSATGVTGPDGTPGWDQLRGALRLGDRLRRRAPRVRRRGGRRVARRAAQRRRRPPARLAGARREQPHERRPRAGLAAAGAGALPPDAARTCRWPRSPPTSASRPDQICKDLKVLWMCGLPGLTPDKMIDVDFEAIEDDPDGVVRIDNADYLARPVRLGSSEASALIVALRALREGSPGVLPRGDRPRAWSSSRRPRPRARRRRQVELHLRAVRRPAERHAAALSEAIAQQPAGAPRLLRADARRDHDAAPSTRWSC